MAYSIKITILISIAAYLFFNLKIGGWMKIMAIVILITLCAFFYDLISWNYDRGKTQSEV